VKVRRQTSEDENQDNDHCVQLYNGLTTKMKMNMRRQTSV
jgi:hypothetical protein